jgi:hypothetical protein
MINGWCSGAVRHKERTMTPFENLKKRISRVVASHSIEDKSVLLEESKQAGFFDGFDGVQVMVLKTGLSDVWRTRLEVAAEQQVRAKVLQVV